MGTVERREREKKQRREDIIDAAERVFSAKGFVNATIDDIANEAELSKGALYLYFKNKKELCLAIIVRILRQISSRFEDILHQQGKGIDKILTLASAFLDFYNDSPDYITALLYYSTHKLNVESKILQEAITENEKINNIITNIIESGIEDGSIRSDIDTVKFSYALWGQLSGLLPAFTLSFNEIKQTPKYTPYEIYTYIFTLIQKELRAKN